MRRPTVCPAVLAAILAFAVPPAAQAQLGPVAVVPETAAFPFGKLQLTVLRDAAANAPNDAKVFGVDAGVAAVEKVLEDAGAPAGQISLSVNVLLVRLPGHVVLVDTGYGAPRGILLASLAKAGIAPAAITDVLITHGHGDHAGGLVDADGKSVFPRAVVRMAAPEWASIKAAPANAKLVAGITAQVKTFAPGAAILPGIASVDLHGHTPGHSGYAIVSGAARLLAIGDSAHSYIVSLAKPGWAMGYDKDKVLGAASRTALLTRLAASGETVFSPHFPFPGLGHVERAGEGFTWKAGLTR